MPNEYLDKVKINGTTYDVKDSVSGYLTSETDPTVPSWAKASSKPSYTASEVGAASSTHTHGDITNAGDITATATIASGDRIIINDESASKVTNSSITFGTSTSQYLSNKGTWENIPTSLPASDVSSWAKASTKPTYTASEVGAVATSAVGAASGVVPLNASSKIDSTYLPSYVDDVIEGYYYNNKFYTTSAHTTEIAGETGKIYVDLATNKVYRYGGSAFAEIASGSLVSVSRDLTSGTKIATISVNGTGNDLYAPTPPTVTSTYSSTGTNPINGTGVAAALGTLDSSISATTGQAISAITITDGKIASSSKISVGDANQNAFSNVKVGNTTVAADTTTDTLELVGSGLVTITPDATNDKITISASYTETDPTVPSWAKASTKPTYTASEVGALPSTTVIPTVVDTYSSSGTDAVSGKGVAAALGTLDSSISATTGQAISAITITDGKITNSSKISVGDANQNAFSNVKVGSTTVAADTTTDTLELAAGSNITLTPDATNDKVTIAATVPSVVSTYSSTGTDAINGTGVAAALGTLDSSISATSGQAISAITITDGKIASSSKISVGETNQNAFSNVKVGSSTVAADSKTDTLELVAGDGIILTPDTTNDKITIASNSSGFGGVEMHEITLLSTGWSSGSQSIVIDSNAIATSDFLSIPEASTAEAYSNGGVALSSASVNTTTHQATLTFTCTATPSTTLYTVVLVSTSEMNTSLDLAYAISHYPQIQNGKWYTWDVTNEQWVNSNVKAGITSIVQTTTSTDDGGTNVVTATLSDGTTTTFNIKNGTKGSTGAKGDPGITIDDVYPIGSVYITSTNTNPSTTIGGTWTLVDKEFKSQNVSGGTPANRFAINTTNITSLTTINLTRAGHNLTYELNIKTKVALSDDTLELGTFNLANIGVTSFTRTLRHVMWSDGGNGIAMVTLTPAGVLSSYDVVTKTSGGSISATQDLMGHLTTTLHYENMLDSFCDKFYWKRTA